MIILLLVIFIIIAVLGGQLERSYSDAVETMGILMIIFGIVGIVLTGIATLIFICSVSSSAVIDEKIAMYQEENTAIESQIDELVKNYMEYESDTLSEFKSESSITLVSLYPELKSDTLVQSQITTYTENNNKIKELKENLIMRKVNRWWLYFGK